MQIKVQEIETDIHRLDMSFKTHFNNIHICIFALLIEVKDINIPFFAYATEYS